MNFGLLIGSSGASQAVRAVVVDRLVVHLLILSLMHGLLVVVDTLEEHLARRLVNLLEQHALLHPLLTVLQDSFLEGLLLLGHLVAHGHWINLLVLKRVHNVLE